MDEQISFIHIKSLVSHTKQNESLLQCLNITTQLVNFAHQWMDRDMNRQTNRQADFHFQNFVRGYNNCYILNKKIKKCDRYVLVQYDCKEVNDSTL